MVETVARGLNLAGPAGLLLAALALCGSTHAQARVSYLAGDRDPTTGTCNAVPFGSQAHHTLFANQRYQSLVPASDLGGAGTITGLGFAPCLNSVHDSLALKVTLTNVPASLDLRQSRAFDANVTAGSGTVVVIDRKADSWDQTQDAWSNFGFDRSFVYDGRGSVLIDIMVRGNANALGRPGLHALSDSPRLFAFGWSGAPPVHGTFDRMALKTQLQFGCPTITRFGSGCAGIEIAATSGSSEPGGSFDVAMTGGEGVQPTLLNFGSTATAPFPIDLGNFGLPGCSLYADLLAWMSQSSSSGSASFTVPIPSSTALNRTRLFLQCVHLKPSAAGNTALSNALRVLIGARC